MGYFEGLDSELGIAWRCADSLALRSFLGYALDESPPDRSTISRTRRLIDLETHREVFGWVVSLLAEKDLVTGRTVGIDASTLEANATQGERMRVDAPSPHRRNAHATTCDVPNAPSDPGRAHSESVTRTPNDPS